MHFFFTRQLLAVRKGWKLAELLYVLILIVAIIAIYWPVYQFQFLIGWDDQWFVTNRYTEGGLNWDNISDIFTKFHYGQYAPLNQLYYTVLYGLFGYAPVYYHLAGVLIHCVNAALVYLLINSVTTRLSSLPGKRIRQISFFTALLFAVLPINVEPVAWVSAAKVTWYALYYLLALLCYCRYLKVLKPLYYYLTLIFFACSFGAKEQAVLLPFCLLLLDYVYRRDFGNKVVWLEKAPFLVLSILFGLITIESQGIDAGARSFYPLYQRIPLSFYTLSEYFIKCLLPVNISYLYPYPFQAGQSVPWWLWAHVFAIPLIIYCFFNQIRNRWVLFGLLFFFIHIILVVNLFSLARFSVIADRYAYLSSVGLCFLVSVAFFRYVYITKYRNAWLFIGALYILLLAAYSASHLSVWKDAYSLKERLKTTIENRKDFDILKRLK